MATTSNYHASSSWARHLATTAFAVVLGMGLASCGGGGVSNNTTTVGGSLQVLPGTVDTYAAFPLTFTISGGTKPYQVFSSNPALVPPPNPSTLDGTGFTLYANNPTADTNVTITVRDNAGATTTSTVNTKASTLDNQISITPSAGLSCGSAVCTGGDAVITTKATLNGANLANRNIRYDVYQGAFDIITPGSNALVSTLTVATGADGNSQVVIRVRNGVPSQTGIIQVTDVSGGQTRRFSFSIQQQTSSTEISITPNTFTWTGFYNNACVGSSGITTHYIYGGTPPYVIQSTVPTFAAMAPLHPDQTTYPGGAIVTTNGGAVTVGMTGLFCSSTGNVFVVTDSKQRTATFSIANNLGSNTPPASPSAVTLPAPTVTPSTSVGPLACGISSNVFVSQSVPSGYTGATGTLTAISLEPNRVSATLVSGVLTITRLTTGPGGLGSTLVRVSNGVSGVSPTDITVSFTGAAPFACTSTTATPITTGTPLQSVTLSAIAATASVPISGGTAPYTVTSSAPTIVQVSLDGVNFGTSVAIPAGTASPAFILKRGATTGITFVTISDSTPVAQGGPLTTYVTVTNN